VLELSFNVVVSILFSQVLPSPDSRHWGSGRFSLIF